MLHRGVKFDKRITCMSVSGGVLDYTQLPELLNWKGGAPLRVYWANQVGQVCVCLSVLKNIQSCLFY